MNAMRLSSIHIYPIKAVRGVSLESAIVEARGLRGDRRWLIVDGDNRFLSQRSHPVLATLQATVRDNGLELVAPGFETLFVAGPGNERRILVTVWQSEVDAVDAGDEAAEWLSRLVESPVRLVAMDDRSVRPVDPTFGKATDVVSFADGFPLLLTSESSLDDLNSRMETPVPMNRFRPNLVIEGAVPWQENDWKRIRIGSLDLRSVKPCARCLVTTTDQETGERMGEEPLRTLATYRRWEGKAIFGTNLIPDDEREIRVGDAVEILE